MLWQEVEFILYIKRFFFNELFNNLTMLHLIDNKFLKKLLIYI